MNDNNSTSTVIVSVMAVVIIVFMGSITAYNIHKIDHNDLFQSISRIECGEKR